MICLAISQSLQRRGTKHSPDYVSSVIKPKRLLSKAADCLCLGCISLSPDLARDRLSSNVVASISAHPSVKTNTYSACMTNVLVFCIAQSVPTYIRKVDDCNLLFTSSSHNVQHLILHEVCVSNIDFILVVFSKISRSFDEPVQAESFTFLGISEASSARQSWHCFRGLLGWLRGARK